MFRSSFSRLQAVNCTNAQSTSSLFFLTIHSFPRILLATGRPFQQKQNPELVKNNQQKSQCFSPTVEQQFPVRTRKTFNFKLNNLPPTVLQLHFAQQKWARFFWSCFKYFFLNWFYFSFPSTIGKVSRQLKLQLRGEGGGRKSLKKAQHTLSLTHLYNRADFFFLIFFSFCMNRQLQSRARRENRPTFAWFLNCFFCFVSVWLWEAFNLWRSKFEWKIKRPKHNFWVLKSV